LRLESVVDSLLSNGAADAIQPILARRRPMAADRTAPPNRCPR